MERLRVGVAGTSHWAREVHVPGVAAAEHVDLRQDRMAHASEIVAQLGRTGLPWAEHPVHLLYTDYSRAKGQSLLNSVNILVDLLFR